MELPQTVEWSLHCAWLLAQLPDDGSALPARRIAEFYGLPEAYLAKVLKNLTRAGLLTATSGPRGGYRLARPTDQITALDLVQAVDGAAPAFRCAEIRQRGPIPLPANQCTGPCGIASVMHHAEQAWRDHLAATTLADLLDHAGTGSTTRARQWLTTTETRP